MPKYYVLTTPSKDSDAPQMVVKSFSAKSIPAARAAFDANPPAEDGVYLLCEEAATARVGTNRTATFETSRPRKKKVASGAAKPEKKPKAPKPDAAL